MNLNTVEQPLVSIIVITYNSAQYILETLMSAKNQTYDNIELIVTDDGSADNTVEIARNWISVNSERFKNTRVITSSVNTGIPANCNRGIINSAGEWIKIIAGDDILLDSCIESNISYVSTRKCRFVFSLLVEMNESERGTYLSRSMLKQQQQFTNSKNQLKLYLRHPVFINSPTFFIHRSLFMLVGYYDERFRFMEDQPFIFKTLLNGIRIEFLDEITVRYRIHSSNISREFETRFLGDFELAYRIFSRPLLSNFNPVDLLYKFDQVVFLLKAAALKKNSWGNKLLLRLTNLINPLYYARFIKRMIKHD